MTYNVEPDASTDDESNAITDGGTISIKLALEPTGETVRKEFAIGSFTDVHQDGDVYWCFLDEDGQGRFMLSTDEFRELVAGEQGGDDR